MIEHKESQKIAVEQFLPIQRCSLRKVSFYWRYNAQTEKISDSKRFKTTILDDGNNDHEDDEYDSAYLYVKISFLQFRFCWKNYISENW